MHFLRGGKSTVAKVILLIIAGLLVQGAAYLTFFSISLEGLAEDQGEEFRAEAYGERQAQLVDMVQLAYKVVESYYNRAMDVEALKRQEQEQLKNIVDAVVNQTQEYYRSLQDSEMTGEEIEEAVKELVRGVRFDDGNYIWINDTLPRMVMHPVKPALEGQDLREFKDPEGTFLFNDMVEAVKEGGEGVVSYMWSKPGEEEAKPKISFVRLMPELDWIFGTGAWIEDITDTMKAEALEQVARMRLADGNYFWINDDVRPVPTMVMHPTVPALNGQVLGDAKYEVGTSKQAGLDGRLVLLDEGTNFFAAMVDVARENEGGGFVGYLWPKPKDGGGVTDERFPKLSYVKRFAPWGWVIGMGVYIDEIDAMVADYKQKVREAVFGVTMGSAVMGLIVLVLAVLVSLLVVRRSLVRPLGTLIGHFDILCSGDLDATIRGSLPGEMGILQEHMERMVAALRDKVAEAEGMRSAAEEEKDRAHTAVLEAEEARKKAESARRDGMLEAAGSLEGIVDQLSKAGQELATSVDEVVRAMETQDERTGQTATAMEQMNATALEVARNAGAVSESSNETRVLASEGEDVVRRSVSAMEEVHATTEQLKQDMDALGKRVESIGRIMSVINDIADQTNLLALNAAIEAARAGDAGRGFAVVADEVRKLAEKTMSATKEVEEAVTAVQKDTQRNVKSVDGAAKAVGDATKLVSESGGALAGILDRVQAVSEQIDSIAAAAEEQSATTDEINSTVEDVSRIAAATSRGMHDAAGALDSLGALSARLKAMVEEMRGGHAADGNPEGNREA